jgi:hypothetical protein
VVRDGLFEDTCAREGGYDEGDDVEFATSGFDQVNAGVAIRCAEGNTLIDLR